MTKQDLLIWYAGQRMAEGYTMPQLSSEQALAACERAIHEIDAATGLQRPTAPDVPAALPPRPADDHTRMLPVYERGRAPARGLR